VAAALREVLALERGTGLPSTWYVLLGDPSLARWWQGDVTYRIESHAARGLLDEISSAGHEIGLHGSMRTFTDASQFSAERARLASVIGSEPRGIRQHFLKMRPGATQRAMAAAGFQYDATFGFSDRNGFRLGVADVVGGWDEVHSRPTELDQVPLHWMDRALSKYQGIEDPQQLVADGVALADEVRKHEGAWVGLWHPNLSAPLGYPGAPAAFATLLKELLERAPWTARMSDLVEWRRIRRSARVRRVAPDGRVEIAAGGAGAWPVVAEDAQGRVVT
jgi:peptidoglycan/xylan/chitin deacetylase (PgdA/CDA1 family)